MEFKEAMKIRERMCNYHKICKDCPLNKLADGCIDSMIEVEELDEYEKILEEWIKGHPLMTNADKFVESIKNTFGAKLNENQMSQVRGMCVKGVVGLDVDCNKTNCSECMKWWDKEYREPAKEKEV